MRSAVIFSIEDDFKHILHSVHTPSISSRHSDKGKASLASIQVKFSICQAE